MLINILFFRFYKNALANTQNQQERILLLQQIRAVELEILSVIRAQRDRMSQENENMQIAIDKLNKIYKKQ
jgi:hypothetical protein